MPTIFNFPPGEFKSKMLVLIGKTHLNCGFPLDEDRLNLTINELCDEIQNIKNISFPEIEIAFKKGRIKEYGDYFGLTNVTFILWIKSYLKDNNTLRIRKMVQDEKNKPIVKPEPSDEEKEKKVLGGVLRTFEDFKNGVVLFDPGNYAYNFLDKKGLIKFTTEEKRRIYNETKAKIRVNVVNNKQRTETIQQALDKALNEDLVKAESKREALRQYFKSLVEMEIELSDELT